MRIADIDFILIPEWLTASSTIKPDDDHWISRWRKNFSTAEWLQNSSSAPTEALLTQVEASVRPVMVITHGRGVDVLLDAASDLQKRTLLGGFIVGPSPTVSNGNAGAPAYERLKFPSVMVASDDHPEFEADAAQKLAMELGSHFVAAGALQRIDAQSGQGPWPEGLMRLGWFLKQLSAN